VRFRVAKVVFWGIAKERVDKGVTDDTGYEVVQVVQRQGKRTESDEASLKKSQPTKRITKEAVMLLRSSRTYLT
jgi:hypothetical protein